jgi:hypothetical protein
MQLRVSDGRGGVTDSGPILLSVSNVSPTSDAGGPYGISEGGSLTLAGVGTDPVDALSYSWDINGDGSFGDATGPSPTLTWAQLVALGISDGPSLYNVRLRVDDGDGGITISAPVFLSVANAAPTVTITGPQDVPVGVSQTYVLAASDPSPVDQAANFTYRIDWNGDGIVDQVVVGPASINVAHTFAQPGPVKVRVWATDRDNGASPIVSAQIAVAGVALESNAGLTDLIWGGTSGADQVSFEQLDATTIRVRETLLNGVAVNNVQTYSGITGRVIARGAAGNDVLDAVALSVTKATLDGGAGNNTLYGGQAGDLLIGGSNGGEGQQGHNTIIAGSGNNTIYGNAVVGAEGSTGGNNLIVGGSGSDTIYGSYGSVKKKDGTLSNGGEGGQNLIVGGGGSDTIYASQQADGAEGGKGSILIAGTTALNETALKSVLSEWTSSRSYATKIANISGTGSGPRNNGNTFLQVGTTVANDAAFDELYGDSKGAANWLWYNFTQDLPQRTKADDVKTNTP